MQNSDPLLDTKFDTDSAADLDQGRPIETARVTRGVCRYLISLGLSPLAEFRLSNSRRADVVGVGRKGELVLIEVKSCLADFAADDKWRDYLDYCDRFYFAVGPEFPRDILPQDEGLLIADAYGAMEASPPQVRSLSAARRKATTISFARQAAARLSAIDLY